ncbi:DNA helicase-2/ATP-dependent DNA helicase PcrA [Hazenella coriacea]|uniref:DNA helicase-2/ATP-dependent DNA helicase PcrA n=2 Tax=Hazenella coriacea TaxID=1179467 RepID=A0A4R3L764_9BACL|nr:DNA helicase-2/ATP-dependent DNA helicase PcrA [Hazenella coriacea]
MEKQEWLKEQTRVEQLADEIDKQISILQKGVTKFHSEVVDLRKNFWDDVSVNIDDPGEAAETYISVKQQAEVLSERERHHQLAQKQMKTLQKLKQSPYFGRIDFREHGEKELDKIYLGIASFLDPKGENYLVYDWRAPISSLYYDFSPGPVEYETPSGTVSGEMELKRQYIIRQGRIISMFDAGVTIGDELLQQVLGKQADAQMKSIVATIQKEQNQLIRNEKSRLLIVQGAAGSGKTSAALQRVAYLLYRYRETLRPEQIILFSPNTMFGSYISTVLPELGEENVQQKTFQEYLEHHLAKTFQVEDPFIQMENVLTPSDEGGSRARVAGIQYKATIEFMQMIDQYIRFLGQEGLIFKEIRFRDQVIISAELMRDIFYTLDPMLSIPKRMGLLTDQLLDILTEKERREQSEPWVENEVQLLDHEVYLRVYQRLQREKQYRGNTFNDFDREQEMLSEIVVKKHFKPLRSHVKKLTFIDIPAMYRQLFAQPSLASQLGSSECLPEQWNEICHQTIERLDRLELAYEDATPYLYFKERIEGFHTNTAIRHVFIDEAQDYSPFQFFFIKQIFPHSKITVLGDLNQAIYTHTIDQNGFETLSSYYEAEQTETLILTKSYRSTRQIVEFTRELIPGGKMIEPFNRQGSKPTLTLVKETSELVPLITKRIKALQATGHRSIAIICKTAKESHIAYESLKDHVSLHLIQKETVSFETGILVIPSYLAKGIEFDAVIIFDASELVYGKENERKLFYTACTRAMHELHIYATDQLSPLLSAVPKDCYVMENE